MYYLFMRTYRWQGECQEEGVDFRFWILVISVFVFAPTFLTMCYLSVEIFRVLGPNGNVKSQKLWEENLVMQRNSKCTFLESYDPK